MRKYGSWTEVDDLVFREDTFTITLRPNASTTYTANRVISLPNSDTTDELVGLAATQTLTNKTFTAPVLNGVTTLSIQDNGSNDLIFNSSDGAFTADRTINIDLNDADRTVDLSGNLTLGGNLTSDAAVSFTGAVTTAGAFTTAGAYTLTLTQTGNTNVTLPTTGTLATLAGSETLTNKILTAPQITAGSTLDTDASGTLTIGGTNATTINIGRSGQTTIIKGSLQVDGTTTTVNSATLDVTDANITVNNGGNQAAADGVSGLTVEMSDATDATILYDSSLTSKFKIGESGSESEVITAAGTQAVTGTKTFTTANINAGDINLGTAADTSKLVLSKAATTTLDGLTREQGSIYYDTTLDSVVYDDGTSLTQVGSGSGGGINFIEENSFDSGTTGWTEVEDGADNDSVTITQVTTGNVARGNGSAEIAFTASSTTNEYVEYQFTLPAGYANRPLRLSFLHIDGSTNGYADDQMEVVVVKDPGGTETEYTPWGGAEIKSRSSWYQFETYVNVGAADTYALRFKDVTGSTAMDIRIDDVELGPEDLAIGVPITELNSAVLSVSNFNNTTGLSAADGYIAWKQVGSELYLDMQLTVTGTGSSGSSFELDTSSITGFPSVTFTSGTYGAGTVRIDNATSTSRFTTGLVFKADGTANLAFASTDTGSDLTGAQFGSNGNERDQFTINGFVSVSEYAGSSAYVSQARPEYAYNSNTDDTDDTTNFAYGPAGTEANYTFTTSRKKRVRFLTPIQANDKVELQFSEDRVNWQTLPLITTGTVVFKLYDGSAGATLQPVSGSTTDVDVFFAQYRTGTSSWTSGAEAGYWRVVKIPGQVQVAIPTIAERQEVICDTGNGYGSTNTAIRRFTNATTYGTAITRASTAAAGDSFTINEAGIYCATYVEDTASSTRFGISLNASDLTSATGAINTLAPGERLAQEDTGSNRATVSVTFYAANGDVVRPHTNGANGRDSDENQFRIVQVTRSVN